MYFASSAFIDIFICKINKAVITPFSPQPQGKNGRLKHATYAINKLNKLMFNMEIKQ